MNSVVSHWQAGKKLTQPLLSNTFERLTRFYSVDRVCQDKKVPYERVSSGGRQVFLHLDMNVSPLPVFLLS